MYVATSLCPELTYLSCFSLRLNLPYFLHSRQRIPRKLPRAIATSAISTLVSLPAWSLSTRWQGQAKLNISRIETKFTVVLLQ